MSDDDWLGPPLPWPEPAPPRVDLVTYQVRVELEGVDPPVWRLLDLANDLRLSDVHGILQSAMGWTDSHLHQFEMSPAIGGEVGPFLTPFDVEEGDEGILEDDVRLDQVLVEPGDELGYLYDFGDNWRHVVRLEAIHPYDASGRYARCVGGRRACPPEDCGGANAYQKLQEGLRSSDPGDAWMQEKLDWLGRDFDPDKFSVEATDALLRTS